MSIKKIEIARELSQAERSSYLNRTLESLTDNLNDYLSKIGAELNPHRKTANKIKIGSLAEVEAKIESKLAKQIQKAVNDGILELESSITNPETSSKLETNLDRLLAQIGKRVSDIIGEYRPQPRDKTDRPPKLEPRLFDGNNYRPLPATLPMKTSTLCQLRDDFWQQNSSNGIAYYRQESNTNSDNYIEHYISSTEDIQILPWDSARQIIDKFGFNTVLLQLLFAAHAVKCAQPWQSEFSLSGVDIIRELGWEKRTDIPLHAKLLELANTSFALDCLLIKAVWEDPTRKSRKGKTTVTIDTSRMWNVRVQMTGQMDLEGNIERPEDLHITVRPGMWTRGFMNGSADSQDALYQFGYLARDVIEMNPYHNELALRLAIHLTLDSHFDRITEYRVRDLLEIAMPRYKIDLASRDREWKHKLKQKWDRAVGKLIELGWQIEFDDETYPPELRPNSSIQKNQRGYLEKLLAAKVYIRSTFPQKMGIDINDRLHSLGSSELPPLLAESKPTSKLKTFKTPTEVSTSDFDLRAARNAKGLTQRQLATELGVSQSLIAQWERGNRTIDDKNLAKLQKKLSRSILQKNPSEER